MAFQSLLFQPLLWTALFTVGFVYVVAALVYRYHFHPLAKVPGPALASVTYLYQSYFNIAKGGRFYEEIERLHGIYGSSSSGIWLTRANETGPIIRINPNEVHLSDPEHFDTIHYVGSKYSKTPYFYHAFSEGSAAFSTPSNELHRIRRAALNPFFSRQKVLELESVVHTCVDKLCARLTEAQSTKVPVNLHNGLRAVSVDVITDYAFNDCYNLLDRPDLGGEHCALIRELAPAVWFFQQWPALMPIGRSLPYWLAMKLSPALGAFMRFQSACRKNIETIKERRDSGKGIERTTIFDQLLDPNASEDYVVPSVDDLTDEAYVILSAASDTTGNAMTRVCYHVVSDGKLYAKLSAELEAAFPDPNQYLDYTTLQKLPYLVRIRIS
jgi:cytochrome P450